jgi:hypothetical protein
MGLLLLLRQAHSKKVLLFLLESLQGDGPTPLTRYGNREMGLLLLLGRSTGRWGCSSMLYQEISRYF